MLWEQSTIWMPGLCMHSLPDLVDCRVDRQKYSKKRSMAIRYIKSLHQCHVNTMQRMQHKFIWEKLTSQCTVVYSQFLWKPAVASKCSSSCWWMLTSLLWKYINDVCLSSHLGSDCCTCLHISQLKSVIHEQLKTGQGNKWINDDRFLPSSLNKSWPFTL